MAQTPSFRFLATGAVVSLFFLTFLIFGLHRSEGSTRYFLKSSRPSPPQCPSVESSAPSNDAWEFIVGRDGQNHGLSEEQCRIAFPKLYAEIDKSVLLKQEKHITYKELDSRDVEEGMVRGIIDQGEVSDCSSP